MAIETHIRDIELATNGKDMREPIADAFREIYSKYNNLEIDDTPTEDSSNLVKSGGVYDLWNSIANPNEILLPTDELILGEKLILAPGTYEAIDDNLDGYSTVIADQNIGKLDANLQSKYIYAVGEYNAADDNCDGYSRVVVDLADTESFLPVINRTVSEVAIRNDITEIGPYAFYSCDRLKSITLPACEFIKEHAFEKCVLISYASFNQCTRLETGAFLNCTNLKHITLSALENIPNLAFADCVNFSFIDCLLSNDRTDLVVHSIGDSAFCNCSKLPGFYYSEWNIFTGDYDINYAGITAEQDIGSYAFYNCSSLSVPIDLVDKNLLDLSHHANWISVYSYSNVHTIGAYAFYNCSKLSTMHCELTNFSSDYYLADENMELIIGSSAFQNCYNLMNFTMRANKIHIYENAFENCIFKYDIRGYGPTEITVEAKAFKNASFQGIGLSADFTPTGKLYTKYIGKNAFQYANGGLGFLNEPMLSDDTCIIDEYAFDHNIGINTVNFGRHAVMSMAFANCVNLSTITLGAGTIVHSSAFYSCHSFNKIIIPSGVYASEVELASNAFDGTPFEEYDTASDTDRPVITISTDWDNWIMHPTLSRFISYFKSATT